MASSLTRTFVFGSRVVQTSFVRTLATQQGKGPMDYVKQGVDQISQAAGKVKDAVTGGSDTNNPSGGYGGSGSGSQSSSGSGINNPSGGYGGSGSGSQSSGSSGQNNPAGGYGGSSSSGSGNQSNPSSQQSGGYGGSGPSTNDKFKDKSGEYSQQNQSAADKASKWTKEIKNDLSSDSNSSTESNINKARDAVKSGADSIKAGADKVADKAKQGY